MFHKVLDALSIKKIRKLNASKLFNYDTMLSTKLPAYYINTRFKYNFKYYMTLIVNQYSVFYFNFRSIVSCNLNNLTRRERYATQTHVMVNFMSYVLDYRMFNLFFCYKNVSFTHFIFLKDFFKVIDFSSIKTKLKKFEFFFNFGLSRSLSRYLKKAKTKKKFKKKMYYKEFLFNFKDVYM